MAGPAAKLKRRSVVGGAAAVVTAHLMEMGLMVAREIGSAWDWEEKDGVLRMLRFLRKRVFGVVVVDVVMVGF